jgi:hypothetical protein
MNCPFCHQPVEERSPATTVGDQKAHASCVQRDAERQTRPFREEVSFDDRPDTKPLKEGLGRELRD